MTNGHSDGNASALMTPEQFASYLERRLTLLDDVISVESREGTMLWLRVRGREVKVNVANFYDAYRSRPAELDSIVSTMVRVLSDELPNREEQTYEELSDRVYPMLKQISMLATVTERQLPMLVYRDFLADLIITYVVDEPRSVTFINEVHMERWGIAVQDLHERALANLRRRTDEHVDYITTNEGDQRLFIFNSQDGYDATRLLLPDLLAEWARQLPGRMVIGIPNRDFLIAFSDANDEIMRNVAQQIQVDSVNRQYGLTDQLFTLTDGQVREYEWT